MCIQAFNTENPLRIKITPSPVTSPPSPRPPPSLCHWWWMLPALQTEKGIDCSLCAFHSNLELSIDARTHNCVKLSCLYQTTCLMHQRPRGEAPREHTDSNHDSKFVQLFNLIVYLFIYRFFIFFLKLWDLVSSIFLFFFYVTWRHQSRQPLLTYCTNDEVVVTLSICVCSLGDGSCDCSPKPTVPISWCSEADWRNDDEHSDGQRVLFVIK